MAPRSSAIPDRRPYPLPSGRAPRPGRAPRGGVRGEGLTADDAARHGAARATPAHPGPGHDSGTPGLRDALTPSSAWHPSVMTSRPPAPPRRRDLVRGRAALASRTLLGGRALSGRQYPVTTQTPSAWWESRGASRLPPKLSSAPRALFITRVGERETFIFMGRGRGAEGGEGGAAVRKVLADCPARPSAPSPPRRGWPMWARGGVRSTSSACSYRLAGS